MEILKALRSKFSDTPFSPEDIRRLGGTPALLKQLLNTQAIHRLNRGVYVLAGADLSDEALFRAATMRIDGPSAVCLVSALAYHGVTDQIPNKVWLLVPETKHTAHKNIRLFRSRNPHWKIGIETHQGYRITNLERSLTEALTARRTLGVTTGVNALKSALKDKKTTLDKVLKMATSLGVDHRIIPYIETLA